MEYVTLNNGLEMPLLGLGVYQLHGEECERCVQAAVELGYRLFDTAQMYGNEKALGNALKNCGIPRKELFITTKLYSPSAGYSRAKSGIEESLNLLQTDYIDLLLIHEPYREASQMYRAMKEAHEEGKIRAVGISNFNENLYSSFIKTCGVIPAVNQVEAHVFFQQERLQNILEGNGTHMEAWSPFAAGKNRIFENPILNAIGQQHGKSAAQIALRFLVQRGITVIPKSSHKERLTENIGIFDFSLSEQEMEQIRALDKGKTLFGWY